MATINVTQAGIRIGFTTGEKIVGLVRDIEVPLAHVRSVQLAPDGLGAVRGVRAPGLGLPGRKLGTWRGRFGKTLVDVRRDQPAVLIETPGSRFDRLLVGADDAQHYVDQLKPLLR